jgi:hypothetical protein
MSRKGDCWDNAVSESFFKILKVERVNDRDYWTQEEATTDITDYIERFYNRKRRHSYLGYISPVEYELQNAAYLGVHKNGACPRSFELPSRHREPYSLCWTPPVPNTLAEDCCTSLPGRKLDSINGHGKADDPQR